MGSKRSSSFVRKVVGPLLVGIGVTAGLFMTSRYNYLLFHTLGESFSIIVAGAIFALAWNTWHIVEHGYLQFLGIALIFVGGLDLVHTLAYKGMGVFPAYDANLPTQLWIAARYVQSLSLLIAPMFLHRRLQRRWVVSGFLLLTALLLWLTFARIFPDCYVEGQGLTPFKIVSEYIIALILGAAIWQLVRRRDAFSSDVFPWMVAAIICTIVSELAFTFYVDVYGLSNLVGHVFKIFAFYAIYHAIVETGLRKPYTLLFRDLQERNAQLAAEVVERKQAQQALMAQGAALARSNADLEQFAYIASHDLQEPLRKIQTFGDRLHTRYGDRLEDRGRDYLDRMRNAASRMRELIDDLLDYSRVTTQAKPFASVSLNAVMDDVIADLYVRIEESGGRVEVGDLPQVEADGVQMRRLLQNLVDNALKFHRAQETPVVKVQAVLEETNGLCRITVADNGIGFDRKYIPKVFAPFQRLHGRGDYDGTGMGMAICRKIAERHNGHITVDSTPDQGSIFTIVLPVEQTVEQTKET